MTMKHLSIILALLVSVSACHRPADGNYSFHILSSNDVHGNYFDSTYIGGNLKKSLITMDWYVDSVRTAEGKEKVILIDAGDCLQGDNAAYYYNYIDTTGKHVWTRIVEEMGYDVLVPGNHDIETGHPVYDRVYRELKKAGLPYLAANAFKEGTRDCYFDRYKIIRKNGFKILVLGYTNHKVKEWLREELWKGIEFEDLIPLVQNDVDELSSKYKPDMVIVAAHTGSGRGAGKDDDNRGMDLLGSLRGVDCIITAHDHSPRVETKPGCCYLNSGSHARYLGHGTVNLEIKNGKVVSKSYDAKFIPIDPKKENAVFRKKFLADFAKAKAFTTRKIGSIAMDLNTVEAYTGPCDYINLLHTICRTSSGADISFAAPLTFKGKIKAGDIIYNDLYTIYPYENQLFVLKMSGEEILRYLNNVYKLWTMTAPDADKRHHALRIVHKEDPRTGQTGWSFVARPYNLDSAGGLVYTVDLTKPEGSKVNIISTADGVPFDTERTYTVAMTSYRASGAGALLKDAGIPEEQLKTRVVAKYPEIRDLLYNYIKEKTIITKEDINRPTIVGTWKMIPEKMAGLLLDKDRKLLVGEDYQSM